MNETLTIAEKVLNKALDLISRRMWFSKALKERLEEKFPGQDKAISEAVEYLESRNYLNDREFAQRYIEHRLDTSPRGVFKIKYELQKKGVDMGVLEEILANLAVDEIELARKALINKKFMNFEGEFPEIENYEEKYKNKQKMYRFLQSRGFRGDAIREVLQGA